jgi:hypothetical protein
MGKLNKSKATVNLFGKSYNTIVLEGEYKDHRGTHELKVEWMTENLNHILGSKEIITKKGIIYPPTELYKLVTEEWIIPPHKVIEGTLSLYGSIGRSFTVEKSTQDLNWTDCVYLLPHEQIVEIDNLELIKNSSLEKPFLRCTSDIYMSWSNGLDDLRKIELDKTNKNISYLVYYNINMSPEKLAIADSYYCAVRLCKVHHHT